MPMLAQYSLLGLWSVSFAVYAWTEGSSHNTVLGACVASILSPLIYCWRLVCTCFQFIGELMCGLLSGLD